MMKYLVASLLCLCSNCWLSAQTSFSDKLWGTYFPSSKEEKLLNICENNQWYYSNCISANIESTDPLKDTCMYNDVFGTFHLFDDTLELRNYKDELLFSFQIVDTMNLKVIYAQNFLQVGSFLNRHSSFFKGHSCRSVFYIDVFARWTVFELENKPPEKSYEILRFSNPGFISENKTYEVDYLPKSIYHE